ncbi:hypothetical protein F5Y16DRAFT_417400 [Xylariaceae sp. FL0255]|nr:hypothetical protein F5Y16DRAFT_417400 [Xylariaceae sp. FL0255]
MATNQILSPWAERFIRSVPPSTTYNDGNIKHSGYAPDHPKLHPKYYADPPGNSPVPRPPFPELDRLFHYERFQKSLLGGITSWQTPTFHKYVYFSDRLDVIDAGHRRGQLRLQQGQINAIPSDLSDPAIVAADEEKDNHLIRTIFDSESIKVDEDQWLPFFKRDRWWNTPDYSMDDDRIWDALKPGLELASRIIKAAIEDQHEALRTMLYGRIDYWKKFAPTPPNDTKRLVLIPLSKERLLSQRAGVPCNGDYMTQFGPAQWTERLQALLSSMSLYVYEPASETDWDRGEFGKTVNRTAGTQRGPIVGINEYYLRSLLSNQSPGLSLSERCFIYFKLATTLVHELMHALIRYRLEQEDQTWANFVAPADKLNSPEPHYDFEELREMGESMEHKLFGGKYRLRPGPPKLTTGIQIGAWYETPPVQGTGSNVLGWWLTSMHASRMMSEVLWNNDPQTPRKSNNNFGYLKIFQIFESRSRQTITAPIPTSGTSGTREYKLLVPDFQDRMKQWNSLRAGWFNSDLAEWSKTEWNQYTFRDVSGLEQSVGKIPWFFEQRDEISCGVIASTLIREMNWRSTVKFMAQLPKPNVTGRENAKWYSHAVALLLMAAMPIRTAALSRKMPETKIRLTPNSKMLSRGYQPVELKTSRPSYREGHLYRSRRVGPSELFNPWAANNTGVTDPATISQTNYLDLCEHLVNHTLSNEVPVEKRWLEALQNTFQAIQNARQNLQTSDWVPNWPFAVPTYDGPAEYVRLDPQTKQMVRYA